MNSIVNCRKDMGMTWIHPSFLWGYHLGVFLRTHFDIQAGLFSGVTSAFTIQIQSELQPDPNPATQTNLLLLLVQNVTGAAVPGMQMAEQAGPTTIIVVAQSLLYCSLLSTLLAALLAVLGKQWLLHYDSVSERGTITERGLERQRKLNGLRHWKFDPVMQILPLLLQLSLLLFAVGLAFYLWTINTVIATMVLALTCGGFVLYCLMVISSLFSPDSPFQTSLGVLLRVLTERITLPHSLRRLCNRTRNMLTPTLPFHSLLSKTSSPNLPLPGLPQFYIGKPNHLLESVAAPIFDEIPEPSQEVSAVIWALETSMDPKLVESAAAIVPDLQWPINLNLQSSLRRLADLFEGCFDGWNVRDGMDERALRCIKAFGVLEILSEHHQRDPINLLTFDPNLITSRSDELTSLVRFFRVENLPKDTSSAPAITQWSLMFISAQKKHLEDLETIIKYETSLQNPQSCADFLFCVNSFFFPPARSDICVRDKR